MCIIVNWKLHYFVLRNISGTLFSWLLFIIYNVDMHVCSHLCDNFCMLLTDASSEVMQDREAIDMPLPLVTFWVMIQVVESGNYHSILVTQVYCASRWNACVMTVIRIQLKTQSGTMCYERKVFYLSVKQLRWQRKMWSTLWRVPLLKSQKVSLALVSFSAFNLTLAERQDSLQITAQDSATDQH